jgi:hypothetical protein
MVRLIGRSEYVPPSCKKVDLIWNKCGHAILHIGLNEDTILNGLKYFLKEYQGQVARPIK